MLTFGLLTIRKTSGAGPEKGNAAGEESGAQDLWGIAKGAGVVHLGGKEVQGRPYHSLPVWKEGVAGGRGREDGLFFQVKSIRTRRNSLKLHQGRIRLNIRNFFFTERVVKGVAGCPGKQLSPPMEVFKKHVLINKQTKSPVNSTAVNYVHFLHWSLECIQI